MKKVLLLLLIISGLTAFNSAAAYALMIPVLPCTNVSVSGTLTSGQSAAGVTVSIQYPNGDGGAYNAESVSSTGVTGLTATRNAGNFAIGSCYLIYTISGTPGSVGKAYFNISFGSTNCTLELDVVPDVPSGSISALSCGTATHTGALTKGLAAIGVSSNLPYNSGNGGYHTAQNIESTGVTGLTATIAAGLFSNGNGSLTYTITGTPSGSGTASFALNIGGQSCTLTRTVTAEYRLGTVHCGGTAVAYAEVTSPTGKSWMDRNLGAAQVAVGSTDADAYGDLYQWGRGADGHQCRSSSITATQSSTDQPVHGNFIAESHDWRSLQNDNLWQGISGVNNPCPEGHRIPTSAEWSAEFASWGSKNSTGAIASPLKLPLAGLRDHNDGSIATAGLHGYYWTSTVFESDASILIFLGDNVSIGNNYYRAYGFSVRCIKAIEASITALNCGTATNNGSLTAGIAASSVTSVVSYSGGNTGEFGAKSVASTGVTGLTASLAAGTVSNGTGGTLTYTISGTPTGSGTASFALNIGGQSCTLTRTVTAAYRSGTVHCGATAIAYSDVTSLTGKTWMDRNLGASRVATVGGDSDAYGDLYQWGRGADGHQCRNSSTTATVSSTDQPGHGNFIRANNWRSPSNNTLWQGESATNNPCPSGYRVPTEAEWLAECNTFSPKSRDGAFASALKFSFAGYRRQSDGSLLNVNLNGYYWTSTIISFARMGTLFAGSASSTDGLRGVGNSVRCIKN